MGDDPLSPAWVYEMLQRGADLGLLQMMVAHRPYLQSRVRTLTTACARSDRARLAEWMTTALVGEWRQLALEGALPFVKVRMLSGHLPYDLFVSAHHAVVHINLGWCHEVDLLIDHLQCADECVDDLACTFQQLLGVLTRSQTHRLCKECCAFLRTSVDQRNIRACLQILGFFLPLRLTSALSFRTSGVMDVVHSLTLPSSSVRRGAYHILAVAAAKDAYTYAKLSHCLWEPMCGVLTFPRTAAECIAMFVASEDRVLPTRVVRALRAVEWAGTPEWKPAMDHLAAYDDDGRWKPCEVVTSDSAGWRVANLALAE